MVEIITQSNVDPEVNFNIPTVEPCYKEVVVIGNGPSGIIQSFFLAGNWPYYNGEGEGSDEMLHHRIIVSGGGVNESSKQKSLVELDLNFLSQVSFTLKVINEKENRL